HQVHAGRKTSTPLSRSFLAAVYVAAWAFQKQKEHPQKTMIVTSAATLEKWLTPRVVRQDQE
ncbi:MAG: hypothetical protein Q9177_005863, partial [Variospora cf. flavescens]